MAEAALVSVATGVIKPLMSKLTKLLEEESAKFKGVRRNTKFIRDELSTMGATLQILADSEELDPQTVIWRDNVRELSYDMDDCINDFMVRVDHHQRDEPTGLKGFFLRLKKLKPRHEIAGKIQKLKARAVEISERRKRYQIDWPTPVSSIHAIDPRIGAFYVEVEKLVGIKGPKEEIIEWFEKNDTSQKPKVMSIVGPGGLGKTTLANQVYNTIKSQFSCAALVSVSRKPDIRKVLRDIAKGVGMICDRSDDDVKQLIDRFRKYLQDKRFLVVVDDIWDTEAWKYISLALTVNNFGSCIIATTRISEVASCCSSQGGHVYQMKPLSFADSKRMLFARAFGSDEVYPHLEEVSKKILEKCAGLPLAIITIASLLADQLAVEEWDRVLAVIGASLAKDPLAGNMTKILSLSYIDLPHHLRTCLLYLSAFPEDHIIRKQSLISRWIAEGFIREELRRSKYEVGEGYFNDLVNRNLIQPIKVKYDQAKACRVHDIILDFIRCKAIEDNFMTSLDGTELRHNSDCTVRRLSVMNLGEEELTMPENMELSHVRSLSLLGSSMEKYSLLFVPSLVMLDIGPCWDQDQDKLRTYDIFDDEDELLEKPDLEDSHLAHIDKMFLLKYLRLGSCQIEKLPRNIEELQSMETLDLRGAEIYELPSTIARLSRLARLYVSQYTSFSDGIIGQMRSLEDLSKFRVSCLEGKSLQEFAQLTNLRTLEVRCDFEPLDGERHKARTEEFYSHVGTLISSGNLHNLYFSVSRWREVYLDDFPMSLESLCHVTHCISLRKLHMLLWPINKVPKWMSSLGNLGELELFVFSMRTEDIAVLGAMPALLFLTLSTFYSTSGRLFIRGFTGLKYFKLEIKCCGTALEFEAGSMQKLEHLELELGLHFTECVNGVTDFGIRHLPALTKVDVIISDNDQYIPDNEYLTNEEAERLTRALIGTLRISPTIWSTNGRGCDTAEDFVQHYIDRFGALPEGVASCETEPDYFGMSNLRVLVSLSPPDTACILSNYGLTSFVAHVSLMWNESTTTRLLTVECILY